MSGRLLAIECRRTIGPWLLPFMVALPWFSAGSNPLPTWFWAESSVVVRDAALYIGPLIAGAAAWMAGRERRRGLGDLLATTPRHRWSRTLTLWAATAVWGLLAYAVFGLYVIAQTATRAMWGTPVLWPMLVGLLSIAMWAAIGYALGEWLPGHVVPAFVAIGVFAAQVAVGQADAWFAFLSPAARVDATVWYGVRPFVAVPQGLFLAGVLLLALSGLAHSGPAHGERWYRLARLTAPLALALIVGGALLIRRDAPGGGTRQLRREPPPSGSHVVAYTPVCTTDPLPVCIHPAYQPWLRESASAINLLAAPLLDLPGTPSRAEQGPPSADRPAGVVGFTLNLYDPRQPRQTSYYPVVGVDIAIALVWDQSVPYGGPARRGAEAQQALALWLTVRADATPEVVPGLLAVRGQQLRKPANVIAATRRFAALDAPQQRQWLRAHYADVRQGMITLEELP